jgi:hypothetical protein
MGNEATMTTHVDGARLDRIDKPAARNRAGNASAKVSTPQKMPKKRPNRQQRGLPLKPLTAGDAWGIRVERAA